MRMQIKISKSKMITIIMCKMCKTKTQYRVDSFSDGLRKAVCGKCSSSGIQYLENLSPDQEESLQRGKVLGEKLARDYESGNILNKIDKKEIDEFISASSKATIVLKNGTTITKNI